jgi:hypothetical protein
MLEVSDNKYEIVVHFELGSFFPSANNSFHKRLGDQITYGASFFRVRDAIRK